MLLKRSKMELNERFEKLCLFKFQYVFIFYASIEKTNLQYRELFNNLQKQNRNLFLIYDYDNPVNTRAGELRGETAIIPCKNSCILCTNVKLNLQEMVKESGYIQSCGQLIFMAPWYDVNTSNMEKQISTFITTREQNRGRLVFYSREGFGKERSREGIDNIKFYKNKYYIGDELVSEYINRIREEGKAEDYSIWKNLLLQEKKDEKIDEELNYSLFLVKDIDLTLKEEDYLNSEEEPQLLFIYHSEYKKENPLHILDEDKPYIPGPYTTPQTLIQSMLSFVPKTTSLIIDPFGGSGGIGIASVLGGVNTFMADMVGKKGMEFNLRLFTEGKLRLQVISYILNGLKKDHNILKKFYTAASQIIESRSFLEKHWNQAADQFLEDSAEETLSYFLFTSHKVLYQNEEIVDHNAELNSAKFWEHLEIELKNQRNAFKRAFELLAGDISEDSDPTPEQFNSIGKKIPVELEKGYVTFITGINNLIGKIHYSGSKLEELSDENNLNKIIKTSERISIVSDLPYGFNTLKSENDDNSISELYGSFFDFALNSIAKTKSKKGDLIISTLRNVKIGKRVSPNSYSRRIEGLLYRKLNEHGFCIYSNPVLYKIGRWIGTGNYWKSNKALDRRIIALSLIKKA